MFEFLKSSLAHDTVVLWAEGERIPWPFEVIVCRVAKTNRTSGSRWFGDLQLLDPNSARRRGHHLAVVY